MAVSNPGAADLGAADPVVALTADLGLRLLQLVVGWQGVERGEPLAALHEQCRNAAGPGGSHLLPERLLSVCNLDKETLATALSRVSGGYSPRLDFRIPPAGRFDSSLVPYGRAGEPRDRWILAIDEGLPPRDQVALYGHALGHMLLNREVRQMGQLPLLDPRDGHTHVDMVGELRQLESTRNPIDLRVLEAYPQLAALLRPVDEASTSYSTADPDLRQRLAKAGWRGSLIQMPYVFTDGRVYVSGSSYRRGSKLRADALLRAEASLPMALVQTVRAGQTQADAEQRMVEYAHDRLNLPFAYLTDESGAVYEFDWTASQEPARTTLTDLPTRDILWYRWITALGLTDEKDQHALRYPYQLSSGQTPRYYQETAINRAVIAVLQAQHGLRKPRILLTLATGTGKTLIAFEIVWKLRRAGVIGNVLFLTDRDYLLGQAMDNAFTPFGQARARIRGDVNTSRDILFATYQSLAGEEGRSGLYHRYPRDFFSLIVVDECHRGSAQDDSNWRAILGYFDAAVQIGLTATPLRTDNVQTYDYFGGPVATYSLRLGITDGFLAPYRVRRVLMGPAVTAVKEEESGTPSGVSDTDERRDDAIAAIDSGMVTIGPALVEQTPIIAEHLATFLRNSGDPMAKTIVFCVDQAHAEQMRAALAQKCADLVSRYPDYVERIVSDEGTDGKRALGRFSTPDEPAPVIVTTSKLLSTGVDVPTCKNVVLARPIGSIVEFKQIIGRGTRLHEPEKTWFTILDYAGATRHFFDPAFDGDPEVVEIEVLTPELDTPEETLQEGDSGAATSAFGTNVSPGAVVYDERPETPGDALIKETLDAPLVPSGEQSSRPPITAAPTDAETGGQEPTIPRQPTGQDSTTGHKLSTDTIPSSPEGASPVVSEGGSPQPEPPEKPPVIVPPPVPEPPIEPIHPGDGRTIVVRGELLYELGSDGRTLRSLSYRQYEDYAKGVVEGLCGNATELRARWLRPEQRDEIRGHLEDAGVDLGELAAAMRQPDADPLDLLLHIAFGQPIMTRRERAERLWHAHPDFFARYQPTAREILQIILTKYVRGEAQDVSNPELLQVPPLGERGTFIELARPFGGGAKVRETLKELQRLLYSA